MPIKDIEGHTAGRARIMRQHRLDLLVSNPSLTWDHSDLVGTESPEMITHTSIQVEPPSPVKPVRPLRFKIPF